MNSEELEKYKLIRDGSCGYYHQERGLIAVWGKEAIQFLNGLITNDVAKLEDGAWMRATFPNAQGRLLALVRVMHQGDKFLFETEQVTQEKVFQNLFRFTFAGDFFVEDLSEKFSYFSILNSKIRIPNTDLISFGSDIFVPKESVKDFMKQLDQAVEISDELYEVLRIEQGIPLYGVDMDETTIVPEIGLPDMISYNKGCYIGQEIIARIYFRGHVAKQLTGLIFENATVLKSGDELKSLDGKNAGKITSICYSPKLEKHIALGYVRYDYLADGTELLLGETSALIETPPFV